MGQSTVITTVSLKAVKIQQLLQQQTCLVHMSEIHGVNTECAEQSFRWLNRFKYSMRNMHQYTLNFFLHVIINK